MATAVKFDCYAEDLAHGVHDFSTDVLKVMLSNTAPDAAADTVDGDIVEITPEDGYVAGGETVVVTAEGQTGGVYTRFHNVTAGTLNYDEITVSVSWTEDGSNKDVTLIGRRNK